MSRSVILRSPRGLSRLCVGRDGALSELAGSGDASLDACWERLARLEPGNTDDLAALRRVWTETSPVAEGWPSTPVPKALRRSEGHKATAAHPRAYAGTTYKPPKEEVGRFDTRPFLERWDVVRRLLELSEPHPYALARWGHDALDIDALDPQLRAVLMRFDADFQVIRRIDLLVRRLGVELPQAFLLVGAEVPGPLEQWLKALLVVPPEKRFSVATELCPDLPHVDSSIIEAMARIVSLGLDAFELRAKRLVEKLRGGAGAAYLAGGFELELEYPARWSEQWWLSKAGQEDVSCLVRDTVAFLAPKSTLPEEQAHIPQSLFDCLGSLPRADRFVRDLLAEPDMSARELRAWLEVPLLIRHEHSPFWEAAHAILPEALSRRASVPAELRAGYASRLLEGVLVLERAEPAQMRRLIAPAERMAGHSDGAMNVYVELLRDGFELPLTASVLKALHKASVRRSQRVLVCAGLEALLFVLPDYCNRLVEAHPARLFRLATRIGAHHPSRIQRALVRAREAPLWSPPLTLEALRGLHAELRELLPEVIPRSLTRLVEGKAELSADQESGRLRKLCGQWDRVQGALIEREVEIEAQQDITLTPRRLSDPERHALDLLPRAGLHRRALKRVLRSALNGQSHGIRQHPETQAWLSQHETIDVDLWTSGVRVEALIDDLGPVRLTIEQDLFEVLKLGDYVRTCLALGAMFESDPAGIALDLNKRVVYARDLRNRVVARQLVALSEAEELVCFPVYSTRESPQLEALFARYDRQLAAKLGVEIASDDDYEIASILSQHLWDDGRWARSDA